MAKFVRFSNGTDPNKVFQVMGSQLIPIYDERDLMERTGTKTVADAWSVANVQPLNTITGSPYENYSYPTQYKETKPTTDQQTQNNQTNVETQHNEGDTRIVNGKTQKYMPDGTWQDVATTDTTTGQKPYIRNPLTNDVYDRNGNIITAEQAAQIPGFWDMVEVTETAPTTGGNIPEPIYDTGNEDLNNIIKSINDVLKTITDSGKIVNPNIDITPDLVKQWADQASAELDPYYKSQFDAIKDDLSTDLTYLTEQYSQVRKTQEATFKQNLATQRESESGAGTIFSGERLTREQQLAQGAERNMESLGTTMGYQAGKAGAAAERTIGSGGLTGLTSPTYSPISVSTTGQGGYTQLGERALFAPSGGVIGSLEREKIEKKRAYSDLLKGYWLAGQNV